MVAIRRGRRIRGRDIGSDRVLRFSCSAVGTGIVRDRIQGKNDAFTGKFDDLFIPDPIQIYTDRFRYAITTRIPVYAAKFSRIGDAIPE